MDGVTVQITTDINPTEDITRVKKAVENIFTCSEEKIEPTKRGDLLVAKIQGLGGLTKLCDLLRRERIRDAARTVFYAGITRKSIVFYLNKQAAYAGHVSFSNSKAESPMGPIRVKIHCDNPQQLIDWLAPRTHR